MAENSKRAAKDFVDKFFPMREPSSKTPDVLGDLFPPKSKQVYPKKQGYEVQSLSSQRATPDGNHRGNPNKSQSIPQNGNNQAMHCEISEPCLMSSSVDYGCRDNYPYDSDNRYPGPSAYMAKNNRKDGSDYSNPEVAGAEWWQGSYYY